MKRYILFIFLSLFINNLIAQQIIKGKITDYNTKEPVSGATITGGSGKTVSSENGHFEIKIPDFVKSLIISHVSYETQEIQLSDPSPFLEISLISNMMNLSTVRVTGYENNRRLMETAGAIGLLNAQQLRRGDNMDILPALNTIPGVKMEAYSAGNYRIAIRGSLINNPWGIRNVRIYWNEIPLSSPDGTAQKSIDFDPAIIGSVEVLKGPSGSIYGAGNGGVLLIKNSKAEIGQTAAETGYTAGSYGFSRFHASFKTSGDNANVIANLVSQRYEGYRENNWGNKDVINIFSQLTVNPERNLNLFVTHTTGSLGIAGGLSKEQMDENPRQALQFNKDNKISVKKYDATAVGISQIYRFSDNFSNTSGIYTNFQTYDHPYGSSIYYNGYLHESLSGYGGRTKFVWNNQTGKISARINIGGEYQYQYQIANTYEVINDQPGTWPEDGDLFQSDIVKSKATAVFVQAELDLPCNFFLTVGGSYTRLSYDILDLFKSSSHTDYSGLLRFPAKFSPRVGLVKLLGEYLSVHASTSYGYSPPPLWEINNYDGTLNKSIFPEDGINYELGLRGNLLNNKLDFDITTYQMFLKNAVVPVVRPNGTTAYKNAGSTTQKGLEAMLTYQFISDATKPVSQMKGWLSYAYSNYKFREYTTQSYDWSTNTVITLDHSGNKVTGVMPHSLSAGIDLETKCGIYFNTTGYYYDKTPLNDANTYYADAYTQINAKFGYKKSIRCFQVDIFAGINNAGNTQYSSLLLYNADANGVPPQFYNPSAGRNFYGGMKLKLVLK
ncbi:MAG TPA: TonB-dependent receptor [Parasegetibacter sp.]